ncbi:hypothetical protein [Rhodococcus sp. IEGM 1307]|uniref:hypothetical protein n=1 Tax=Rhodococcus sp. IEGM 1307 TaxID=3047091 RepID=UPI0032D58EA1
MFFGSTILDTGAHHTPRSRALNSLYNGPITLFHNRGDDLDGLHTALAAAFGEVEISIVGAVAVFAARLPRRLGSWYGARERRAEHVRPPREHHPAVPDPRWSNSAIAFGYIGPLVIYFAHVI